MELPDEVLEIIRQAAAAHRDQPTAGVNEAFAAIQQLPCFPEITQQLMREAVRDRLYAERHRLNQQLRNHGPVTPPVNPLAPGAVTQAYRSLYDYCLGGRSLGSLTALDLADVATASRSAAAGHLFNARLAEELVPLLAEGQSVRQCVPEPVLRDVFERARRPRAQTA